MRALRVIAARLVAAVPTVALVSLGTFLLLEFAPGDAADAYLAQTGGDAGFAGALRERLGLTGSTLDRLVRYYGGLLRGDLGVSAVFNRPGWSVILERLPASKLAVVDAGHFTWEDAADEYAALVTGWWSGGYAVVGRRPAD